MAEGRFVAVAGTVLRGKRRGSELSVLGKLCVDLDTLSDMRWSSNVDDHTVISH